MPFSSDPDPQGAAQAALGQSEAWFRLMADAAPQILWVTDGDGRVEFFNRQWRDYTGLAFNPATAAEVAAATVHPDDVAVTMERFDAARAGGGSFLVEHRIRAASGEYRWFLVRANPWRDPDGGRITRWFGASVDIHDRKLAEDSDRRAAEFQRFQLTLADRLHGMQAPDDITAAAGELLGRQLGAGRVLFAEVDAAQGLVALHRDWTDGTLPALGGRRIALADAGAPVIDAMHAGRVLVVADVAADAGLGSHRDVLAAVGVGAFVAVPLLRNGSLLAVLAVHAAAARHWAAADIAMARDTLERTWTAVEAARVQMAARADAQRIQLAMAAGAIIGTWLWDVRADRTTIDEAFAATFGLDPALGRDNLPLARIVARVHRDDRAGLTAAIDKAVRQGGHYAHQYRVRRANGRYYWVEANGRVNMGPDGKASTLPGILIDVEGRRAVEAQRDQAILALRTLNAQLEQKVLAQSFARGRTWQISSDILGVLNGQGYFEAANPAWGATLGWSEDELARIFLLDLVHPDDRQATLAVWHNARDRNLPTLRFANRCRHKAGGWRWLSWVAVPDEGKVYCSARDITVEKEAQAALVARTAERDHMWNISPDLMLVIDFDGVLRRVNPAWTRVLGYEAGELLDRHVNEFVVPEDHASTVDAYTEAAGGGTPRLVNRYRHKDGSVRWISWVAAPSGAMTYATGRDITAEREQQAELEQAQEQLRQSQKMEAVGQLTGGLAHDFNNLLAGILGSLELMNMRIAQGRLQDVERYSAVALGATKRAAALTHRLLAFSRRQTLAPQPTDVNQLADGMLDMIRRTVGPGVRVETDCTPGLWTALVDRPQLENALLNLCLNARDAMPHGGTIAIGTSNCRIDADEAHRNGVPAGEYLVLYVSDTGTGMAPDVIAKAFDPFFTTKPLGQGTGLGLSMIYGFAKQSGGHARIASEPGRGTTVRIYLPRHHGAADGGEDARPATLAPATATGKTVLVVDDEPDVRLLVSDILNDLGYAVIEAADGAGGLEVLQSNVRLDLLISDVGLPGLMNGRQMADAARVRRPDLKVLFITGFAETALLCNGQLAPGMSVLTKPFSLEALGGRIRDMIR